MAPPVPSPHHISYPSVPFPPCVLWLGPQVAPGVLKEQVCLFSLGLISERGGELRGVTPLFPEPSGWQPSPFPVKPAFSFPFTFSFSFCFFPVPPPPGTLHVELSHLGIELVPTIVEA